METVLKIKLWGKDVAAVSWDVNREFATIEFYESFAKNGLNIAPLVMPLDDILRGERMFSFPTHRGKTFKGLSGLLADSLPDDYGNSVIDEWFAAKQMSVKVSPLDRLSYVGKRGMGALEYEPATAIAHFDRDERYSYEQVFQTMRRLFLPYPEMEQMYRRMVFNVVARNHDDHTKNHAFVMNKSGEWSLSPAYDLCYSYSPSGKWTSRHQLSLNGKRDDFTLQDLLIVAEKSDIKNARQIVQQITETVSHWNAYACDSEVKQEHIDQIEKTLRLRF